MIMFKRFFVTAGCLTLLLTSTSASAQRTLVFAVNEGVTYRTGADVTRQNYKAIADDLGKLLRAKVQLEVIGEYAMLEKDLAAKRYDLAFIHPTHIALAPVKKGDYTLVATSQAHTAYKASFLTKIIVQPGTPAELGRLLAANTKMIGSPDTNSITAWLIRATLRDAAFAAKNPVPQLKFTRYQDSIPFMIEGGFVDVAATASEPIVKQWLATGGKVLATSRAVPIKNVIVNAALGKDATDAVGEYFISLSSSVEGQAKLERIGLKQGFVAYDKATYIGIATWLGL